MKLLFLDCGMGCAGDMLSAALLALCPDPAGVLEKLNALGIPGVRYTAENAEKCGIVGTRLRVTCLGDEEGGSAPHAHHGLHLGDIRALIASLAMPEAAKVNAGRVYDLLASAESAAHGVPMEHIHFHELGTLDAVADIAAVCFLLELLAPERIVCSPVRTGFGAVKCAHGILPVPAPAAASLLTGIPTFAGDIEGELCTPTGAALLKAFASDFGRQPAMTVAVVGYGMGTKDFPAANCVRALLGEAAEQIVELCCEVDDMTGEDIGYAIGALRRAGALDVSWQAVGMKKDRPGVRLTCLCRPDRRDTLVRLIFQLTATLGIREALCARYILRRSFETEETPWGPVRLKRAEGWDTARTKPEYDDIAAIAEKTGLSPAEIRNQLSGGRDDA